MSLQQTHLVATQSASLQVVSASQLNTINCSLIQPKREMQNAHASSIKFSILEIELGVNMLSILIMKERMNYTCCYGYSFVYFAKLTGKNDTFKSSPIFSIINIMILHLSLSVSPAISLRCDHNVAFNQLEMNEWIYSLYGQTNASWFAFVIQVFYSRSESKDCASRNCCHEWSWLLNLNNFIYRGIKLLCLRFLKNAN